MKFARSIPVGAGAVALLVAVTGTASAGAGTKANVSGGSAVLNVDWRSRYTAGVKITVTDTAADGARAEGRIQATDRRGNVRWSSWLKVSGKGKKIADSYNSEDENGIRSLRVQVCRVKGSNKVCQTSGKVGNPYF
ncbi:hypothetical protein [Streptomyces flavofungini]|uniref:Secreted protein n=1 Tax=Streptomyces flavofungini TaxID=68200 RepID=A0ABS0X0I5_9ACTN|nr:hypothetical protein [Streptomyces flavofungini]MBJ3806581.1 hypothetical protein [Streptomyces flavofungini]GHC61902.1 hypothetical protein GCM10010349_32100 [Streptomyces flavofungini]